MKVFFDALRGHIHSAEPPGIFFATAATAIATAFSATALAQDADKPAESEPTEATGDETPDKKPDKKPDKPEATPDDPKGDGTGGSGVKLPAEFSKYAFVRGTVGMARSSNPNSADSQFFICFGPSRFLDGKYTVWGRVIDGMGYVDKIQRGDERRNGTVENPDQIVRMQLATDAKN